MAQEIGVYFPSDLPSDQWITRFLQKHCTEQDDHDEPHKSCRKCGEMRTELESFAEAVHNDDWDDE